MSAWKTGVTHGIAGSVASIIVCILTHPLDTLRVLHSTGSKASLFELDARQLLAGVWLACIESGWYNLCNYAFYHALKTSYELATGTGKPDQLMPPMISLVVGVAGGWGSEFLNCPVDTVKLYVQSRRARGQKEETGGAINAKGAAENIISANGITGLWRGLTIGLLCSPANSALTFFFFERLKYYWLRRVGPITSYALFLVGGLARAGAIVFVYPLIVLKTNLRAADVHQYSSMVDAAQQLWSHGGARRFYHGITSALLKDSSKNAIREVIKASLEAFVLLHIMTWSTATLVTTAAAGVPLLAWLALRS
jgi:hypothetical protein